MKSIQGIYRECIGIYVPKPSTLSPEHIYIYIYIYTCICIYIYMYVCIQKHMCIYVNGLGSRD